MRASFSLDDLWNSVPPSRGSFTSAQICEFPAGAQRLLGHAIAPGTPLASAVRLRMHGMIKLKGWCPFSAEQVIRWDRGMIWRASVRIRGMLIRGSDSFIDGEGAMRWKLFGILPIINASGPDITRSAAGRLNIESTWLPSVLCGSDVVWTETDTSLRARFAAHGETAEIDCTANEDGRIMAVSMPRWGNPGGAKFAYYSFGGLVEQESRFSGYTIPSKLRAGWRFGTEKFEPEGEFYRVTIEDASYR
jgi:hypothetical protein